MRLLCTGDIHLGRRPTRIPVDHPDAARFSTAAGWRRIVELAIVEQVDALLISGDLVDLENRYYEALGPVETGIERLRDRGIPVVAVAGNHDFSVTPRLADRYGDGFRLLGRGQRWERCTLTDASGRPRLHIDGWSFGQEHVAIDPLATYALPEVSDAPVIGLLHADLDAAGSRYAPVRLRDLHAAPVSAWLLGHIHVPRLHEVPGAPPVLYPGSPYPLDPGESGKHGVWFLELEASQPARFSFRSIARLRYQVLDVDLTGVATPLEATTRVIELVRDHLNQAIAEPDGSELEYALFRVRLIGRLPIGLDLANEMETLRNDFRFERGAFETMQHATRPQVDLATLATEKSPPGVLARILLDLQEPRPSAPLIELARREVATLSQQSHYRDVVDVAALEPRDLLETASWQLLETLLAQREQRP